MNKNDDKIYLLIGVLYPIFVTLFSGWSLITITIPFFAATIWGGKQLGGNRGFYFVCILCIEFMIVIYLFAIAPGLLSRGGRPDLSGVTG